MDSTMGHQKEKTKWWRGVRAPLRGMYLDYQREWKKQVPPSGFPPSRGTYQLVAIESGSDLLYSRTGVVRLSHRVT